MTNGVNCYKANIVQYLWLPLLSWFLYKLRSSVISIFGKTEPTGGNIICFQKDRQCRLWWSFWFVQVLICFTHGDNIVLDQKLNRDGRRVPFCYCGRQSDEAWHTWWLCFLGIFVVPSGWVSPRASVSPLYSTRIRGTYGILFQSF